jgi:hypothetical protein
VILRTAGSDWRLVVGAVLLGVAAAGCGDEKAAGSCIRGVSWQGREYLDDSSKTLPRGAALGEAPELCGPNREPRRFAIERVAGVPPALAIAVVDRPGILLVTGSPVALARHPLHDLYFSSRARPRRLASSRCSGRGVLRGSVVTPISANTQFRLRVAGSRERLARDRERVVQYHARTIVTRRQLGYPYLPQKAKVEVKGRWCRGDDDLRVLAADLIAPRS